MMQGSGSFRALSSGSGGGKALSFGSQHCFTEWKLNK
jgi:hypothetical protein